MLHEMPYLSEEAQASLMQRASQEMDLSWTEADDARAKRWQPMFDPDKHKDAANKQLVDIMEDPVLKHYRTNEAEARKIQWMTEFCLDNMAREAGNKINGTGVLTETTNKTDIAAFTTWALPMTRYYLPKQFLMQIVPTYPMSQATGKHYTLDTTYGAGGTYASGTSIYGNPDASYADDPGECVEPNQLDLAVTDVDLTAITKKLRGIWNIEAAQDLQSYHRLIMENEIVKMLGVQINREINRYGINQIVNGASTVTNWNSTQPMAAANAWSNATPRQYAEFLWDTIEDANRAIKDAVFLNANFILCGTTFAARLRKLNGFRLNMDAGEGMTSQVVTGPNLFGSLNSRYTLFEDIDFPTDKALIGVRSNNWMYTGAVYCPYVYAWRTPVIHATTLCPAVGYLSRFAFELINGDFYGMIVVS